MGSLYVDRRGSELEFERGALVVREPEAGPRTVPLNLIDRLVVIGNARISGSLLTRLADNGTAVTFLPARGQRRSSFLLGMGHGDALRRIGQYRLATDAWARVLWQKGERTSHSQGRRVPMCAIVGEFHLRGGIDPLWPWLWTGQWTHIGKSAVMGLGRYELEAA